MRHRNPRSLLSRTLEWGALLTILAGCGTGLEGEQSFFVEPGKFQFLRCPDLAQRSVAASARERELTSLMERANQEAVGRLVNAFVYAADLEQVRAELRLLQQTAHEKDCDNTAARPKTPPQ